MKLKIIAAFAASIYACSSAAAGLPSIVVTVETSIVDGDRRQVIPIEPKIIDDAITLAATRAGFGIAGSNAIPVVVRIDEYSSGQRFGGSKTANIDADILARDNSMGKVTCTRTVKFDLRSTEKRNRQAVDECVADFARNIVSRLAGALAQ